MKAKLTCYGTLTPSSLFYTNKDRQLMFHMLSLYLALGEAFRYFYLM